MVVRLIVFLIAANLICRSTDISKYFIVSLGVRDNESRLYWGVKVLHVNPFTLSGLFYHNSLDWSISNSRVSGWFLLSLLFYRNSCNKCSVDPNQILHFGLRQDLISSFVLGKVKALSPKKSY